MSSIDFRTLNLNLLPALEALLVERTVGGAARRFGVSQSAMSHSLAKLRAALGDPLLVMSGRRMRLTPRAEELLGALPQALTGLRQVLQGAQAFDPRVSERVFTVASLDYFDFAVMPSLLAYLREHAPGIRLHVKRADGSTVPRLVAGELEAMFVGSSADVPRQGLHRRPLYRDPFKVIARAGHPRVRGRISLKAYLECDHVQVRVDDGGPGVVDRMLRERGQSRNIALCVPHFASAPLAVAGSDLLCTLASTMAARAKELFGVRVYSPPIRPPAPTIVMYWPRSHDADPGRRWFRELILRGVGMPAGIRRLMAASAELGPEA